jgi:hypothetical protein
MNDATNKVKTATLSTATVATLDGWRKQLNRVLGTKLTDTQRAEVLRQRARVQAELDRRQ